MKTLIILSFLLSFNIFSAEVGDKLECTKLDELTPSGKIVNNCIGDKKSVQKYTIIEFMSVMCRPCVSMLPMISRLGKEVEEIATVRLVSIDTNDSIINTFLDNPEYSKFLTVPFAFDRERVAMRKLKIKYTPTLFVINDKNEIIYKHIGASEDDDLFIKEIKDLFHE